MTKEQAQRQLEAFFLSIGEKASIFGEKNFVKARIGEAVLGFEFDVENDLLSAKALVYRFRREPKEKVLDRIESAGQRSNTGDGKIVFDPQELTLYLQRDFDDELSDKIFFDDINRLAQASLKWSSEILQDVAERASAS